MSEETFESRGSLKIFVRSWLPPTPARAVVVLVHGFNSHGGLISKDGYEAQTVAELVRADERLKREFSRLTLPVLILHGTGDRAAKAHGSQVFYEAAASKDKTLKLYEGHFHDLLNDLGREQVMADITDWLAARTVKG